MWHIFLFKARLSYALLTLEKNIGSGVYKQYTSFLLKIWKASVDIHLNIGNEDKFPSLGTLHCIIAMPMYQLTPGPRLILGWQ